MISSDLKHGSLDFKPSNWISANFIFQIIFNNFKLQQYDFYLSFFFFLKAIKLN